MHNRRTSSIVIAGVFAVASASGALADVITYDIVWEPVTTTHNTVATGSITVDTALLGPTGMQVAWDFSNPLSPFSDFSVTITGTPGGADDGMYTSAGGDLPGVIWLQDGPLDFNQELVAQPNFNRLRLFSTSPAGVPFGDGVSNLIVPRDAGGFFSMRLVSITPIPAPGAFALFGLASVVTSRRRR